MLEEFIRAPALLFAMSPEQANNLRTEYEKAQDSAEHYNQMIWILIPAFFGFVFYIVANYDSLKIPFLDQPGLIMVASFALFFMGILVEGAHAKVLLKYNICKTIEKQMKFIGQNSLVDNLGIGQGYSINVIRSVRKTLIWLFAGWALKVFIEALAVSHGSCTRPVVATFFTLLGTIATLYAESTLYKKYPVKEDILKIISHRLNEMHVKKASKTKK